ncbi:MAG: GNAT family N-acetyltransferase [Pseudomonadota bacterium]
MNNWKQRFASKIISVDEAAQRVKNGDRLYLGSMCSEAKAVIEALGRAYLDDVEMIQFNAGRTALDLAAKSKGRFRLKRFFVGSRSGSAEQVPEADYVPLFHSQIPDFFRNRRIPIDVAIIQVSPPDTSNRFSLGISVDTALAAVESARVVIAQVNPHMPRTRGDTLIEGDRITYFTESDEELTEIAEEVLGEREKTISRYCSELMDDGAVLHFGFAGISRGLMDCLTEHRHLGLHTEIMTDGLMDLIQAGVIDNSTKRMYRGRSLASCCMGTRRLYDYVHENPRIELFPSDVLMNPSFIATNSKMVSVNLALQVDLKGQIRQGMATWTAFEGSGGDYDFMRGATLSPGGRSIICLRSTSLKSGKSTIVPSFGAGASVMTNRGDVQYIVTEFGIAYLGGKSIRERTMALIEVAHPDHREDLAKQAREMGYLDRDEFYFRTVSPALRRRVRTEKTFKGGLETHVRIIKPTDESMIRDLFYNMSESSVYFRYFSPRKSMPHSNVRQYCNVPEKDGLSVVVTFGPREVRSIIAEARYMLYPEGDFADVAFMVDEAYHGRGIATYLLNYLTEIAQERGVEGFTADVLVSNTPMMKVFEKVPYQVRKSVSEGVFSLKWRFDEPR